MGTSGTQACPLPRDRVRLVAGLFRRYDRADRNMVPNVRRKSFADRLQSVDFYSLEGSTSSREFRLSMTIKPLRASRKTPVT